MCACAGMCMWAHIFVCFCLCMCVWCCVCMLMCMGTGIYLFSLRWYSSSTSYPLFWAYNSMLRLHWLASKPWVGMFSPSKYQDYKHRPQELALLTCVSSEDPTWVLMITRQKLCQFISQLPHSPFDCSMILFLENSPLLSILLLFFLALVDKKCSKLFSLKISIRTNKQTKIFSDHHLTHVHSESFLFLPFVFEPHK